MTARDGNTKLALLEQQVVTVTVRVMVPVKAVVGVLSEALKSHTNHTEHIYPLFVLALPK